VSEGGAASSPSPEGEQTGLRLSELMAVMSLATDLGIGAPLETGLVICQLAVHIGERMGLPDDELRRTYYLALLRHIGCTAKADPMAEAIGSDLVLGEAVAAVDMANPREVIPAVLGVVHERFPGRRFPLAATRALAFGMRMREGYRAMCEVAGMLAVRLGFDTRFERDVMLIGERWDGKGSPGAASGEELPLAVRAVHLAEGVGNLRRTMPGDQIVLVVRDRRGSAYPPDAVDAFLPAAEAILGSVSQAGSIWEQVMAAEPGPIEPLFEERLDGTFRALADFSDLKSRYLVGHSSGVAMLARAAGRLARLPAGDVVTLYRAALAHDVGRVGVNSALWSKAGALSADEWEQVRMHAYYSDRVLARPGMLRQVGSVASLHHERVDASGYFRGLAAAQQPAAARILAAADAFHAMTEPRPHRPAMCVDQAANELRAEVRAGRLDADAAEVVLQAAGQPARRRRDQVAGLTARELEVLRLLARGASTRQIAQALVIAPKTADAHIQHIYTKAGVSTRAAATLFAMQHDLLGPADA
jgi:HD-GYP domain-containing protein (c-di-GMP phosphodiesterase class II)